MHERGRAGAAGAALAVGLAFGVTAASLGPAVAQTAPAPGAPAQTVPGQATPPARSGDPAETLRDFLSRAHSVWRRAEWQSVQWDGDAIAARLPDTHPLDTAGAAGPVRIAPDVLARGVSLTLPWRNVRIEAARAALVGEHLVLEGFTLANEAGTLGVGALVVSAASLRGLGAAIAGIEDGAPVSPGDVVFDGLAIEVRRASPDGSGREFASRFSAEELALVGLTLRTQPRPAGDPDGDEGPTALLDVAGLDATGITGAARFAGTANLSLGTLSFRGSPRALAQAAQAVIGLAEPPADANGFSFSFGDFAFTARRGAAPAAGVVAERGSAVASFGGSASRVAVALSGARATASLFSGSPAEPVVQAIVARAGPVRAPVGLDQGPFLALDLEADAVLRNERARVRVTCLAFPGVADAVASLDLTLPPGADPLDLSASTLLGARSEGVRFAIVDHGLGRMVREATGSSVSQLIGDRAVAVLESRLPGPLALMTAPPLRAAIGIFDEQGSLSVAAPNAAPLPLALGALLTSAGPVAPGTLETCGG